MIFVLTSVELEQKDVYRIDGHLDCRMYFDFCNYPGLDELRYEPFDSKIPSELVDHEGESLFSIIGKQDLFVHHPLNLSLWLNNLLPKLQLILMCLLLNKPCIA